VQEESNQPTWMMVKDWKNVESETTTMMTMKMRKKAKERNNRRRRISGQEKRKKKPCFHSFCRQFSSQDSQSE
jgi:hypothetical protein